MVDDFGDYPELQSQIDENEQTIADIDVCTAFTSCNPWFSDSQSTWNDYAIEQKDLVKKLRRKAIYNKKKIKRLEAHHRRRRDQDAMNFADLSATVDTLHANIQKRDADMSTMRQERDADMSTMRKDIQKRDAQIARHESQISKRDAQIARHEAQISKRDADIKRLSDTVAELKNFLLRRR
jgi:chromosome segregation ATPase